MYNQPIAFQNPDPKIKIRPVRLDDVGCLCEFCWPERPQAAVYQLVSRAQQIARQGRGLGVVVTGEEAAPVWGYGQLTLWPRAAEISDLIIAEAYRGRGLGTAIIQYLVRAARGMHSSAVEIGASVSNPGALALYRRLGFQDDHEVVLNLGEGNETVLYLRLDLITGTRLCADTTQEETS